MQSDILRATIRAENVIEVQGDKGLTDSLEIQAVKSRSNSQIPGIHLPHEVWYLVIESAASVPNELGYGDASKYLSSKAKMSELRTLACLSKFHRRVALECWAQTLRLFSQRDIRELRSMMTFNNVDIWRCVRSLVCEDSYQVYTAPKNAFNAFMFLDELTLVCHSDINFEEPVVHQEDSMDDGAALVDGDNRSLVAETDHNGNHHNTEPEQLTFQPRMSYRKLLVRLPRSLRVLRVYDSHAPDIYFIQRVAEDCPLLRSLTLARCTIFTCVQCKFWNRLPRSESDAYFSNQGVKAYAAALGKEIARIKNLEEIRTGIYLTDHSAIDVHLTQHAGLDSSLGNDLSLWERACEQCTHEYQEPTFQLEEEATAILARENPKLLKVSWASFCSERRTGWSTHKVLCEGDQRP